jgi:site-specific recombinase
VGGQRLPPAKFMEIAGHVWLLERTRARRRFLVFGNQRRVSEWWLEKYGSLVTNVEFYFLADDGTLEQLR